MQSLLKPVMLVLALVVIAMPALASHHQGPKIGQPAPNFTLPDPDGVNHALSEYKGKIVVLEWTNHECPYVRKHYDTGHMQKLQQQETADGVIWLSIASSAPGMQGYTTPAEAKMVLEKTGAHPTARLLDPGGDVGRLYGAKTTPHMFVINQDGTLIYMGAIDDNPSPRHDTVDTAHNYVLDAIAAAKGGKMPKVTQTRPYGCSVKYSTM